LKLSFKFLSDLTNFQAFYKIRNTDISERKVVTFSPNTKPEGPPLICCPWRLIQYNRSYHPATVSFIHISTRHSVAKRSLINDNLWFQRCWILGFCYQTGRLSNQATPDTTNFSAPISMYCYSLSLLRVALFISSFFFFLQLFPCFLTNNNYASYKLFNYLLQMRKIKRV